MNTKTAKTLVLAGLGGELLLSLLSFFLNLIKVSVGAFFNFLYLPLTILVVVGFFISFLAEQNILDLIIAGGFGMSMFNTLLLVLVPQSTIILLAISLISIVGRFVWAFKLHKDSNTLAALAVVGSFAISFGVSFLLSFIASASDSYPPIYTLISSAAGVATSGALAYAAFMDWQE